MRSAVAPIHADGLTSLKVCLDDNEMILTIDDAEILQSQLSGAVESAREIRAKCDEG